MTNTELELCAKAADAWPQGTNENCWYCDVNAVFDDDGEVDYDRLQGPDPTDDEVYPDRVPYG